MIMCNVKAQTWMSLFVIRRGIETLVSINNRTYRIDKLSESSANWVFIPTSSRFYAAKKINKSKSSFSLIERKERKRAFLSRNCLGIWQQRTETREMVFVFHLWSVRHILFMPSIISIIIF